MCFIETMAPDESTGEVREMYQRQQAHWGYVPGYAKAFSHRPEVLARWAKLLAEIRRPMEDRRFELATFAAAHQLGNTACSLAHGKALAGFIGAEGVLAVATGDSSPALSETETSIVRFARKVAADASTITARDVDSLRQAGLSEAEIFDVVVAVAGRAFFTKVLDGLGVLADSALQGLDESLVGQLVVGRPISNQPVTRIEE